MKLASLTRRISSLGNLLQTPLLLAIRLFWGWQFMIAGWGKLTNLERTAGFFGDLHLPLPYVSAFLAGSAECFGGALLLIGLMSRLAALPLIFTMIVAYATAGHEELTAISRDPDKFVSATPFLFLFASLIILAFGPGAVSVDQWLAHRADKEAKTLRPSPADGKTSS